MGTTELFLSLPWLYFLLGVRAFLPLHVSPARTFLLLTCVIGLIGWARPARIVRGVVLSTRTRNYVVAARGFGGSDFYLLRWHILPETFSVLLTQASLLVPRYIAAEVALVILWIGCERAGAQLGQHAECLAAIQRAGFLWLDACSCSRIIHYFRYLLPARRCSSFAVRISTSLKKQRSVGNGVL